VKHNVDRYGRLVGTVYVGDACANEALVKIVLPGVTGVIALLDLEVPAIHRKIGLWSHPNSRTDRERIGIQP